MPYLSIRQAAADIRSGLITPGELVAETLERIDALDDDIMAFVTVLRDQAFEEAERLGASVVTASFPSVGR